MNTWLTRFFHGPHTRQDRFVALVSPHLRRMYRMAYRWTLDTHEAEDLVQDVLVRLLPRVAELEHVERLGPWLVRVLYRRFVDLYRQRRASPIDASLSLDCMEIDSQCTGEDGGFRRVEMQGALQAALLALEEDWRDIVLLHDVEGYTALEVADIMEISVGTVKSRLHRARAKLKKKLSPGTFQVSEACQG